MLNQNLGAQKYSQQDTSAILYLTSLVMTWPDGLILVVVNISVFLLTRKDILLLPLPYLYVIKWHCT